MIDRIQFKTKTGEGSKSCKMACDLGIKWIMLNTEGMSEFDLEHEAVLCREICDDHEATLIIQNDVELAKRIEADGIHLEQDAMKPMEAREILGTLPLMGATANDWQQVIALKEATVDYILFEYESIEQFVKFSKDMIGNKIVYPLFAMNPKSIDDIKVIAKLSNGGITIGDMLIQSEDKQGQLNLISEAFVDEMDDVIQMNPAQ